MELIYNVGEKSMSRNSNIEKINWKVFFNDNIHNIADAAVVHHLFQEE
jgi:hypothetical protein